MELAQLIALQKAFDERHGWSAEVSEEAAIDLIARELVGLVGEIGEFANLVKKLQLYERFPDRQLAEFNALRNAMREELSDSFVYLLRLSMLMGFDLEKMYLEKLQRNDQRFREFEVEK